MISLNGKMKPMTFHYLPNDLLSMSHTVTNCHPYLFIKIYQMNSLLRRPLKKAHFWVIRVTVFLMKKFQSRWILILAIKGNLYRKGFNCAWKSWFWRIGFLAFFRRNGQHLISIRSLVLGYSYFLWFYLCFISFFGKI